jgi:arylsulfatase A-like enzyme
MNRKILLLLCCILGAAIMFSQTGEPKPNIILIVFDDLNDYVEGYGGHPQVETPNLFALQQKGTTFLNAFTASTLCVPSRTAFLVGKNPDYTGIYKNEDYVSNAFRENFPPDKYLVTLPEWLKDSAGYFTYNIDKIFHCDTCDQQHPDFDDITMDPCSRSLSWNKQTNSGYDVTVPPEDKFQGVENLKWGAIDSANVITMADFRTADTAKNFIDAYANDPSQFCNKPFFLAIGIRKPHSNLFVPEQYFKEDYISDFYAEPYNIPYNYPENSEPANGVVMPPQPDTMWSDYDKLPYLSKFMVGQAIHNDFITWPVDSLSPLPEIITGISDSERISILSESKRANAVLAYLAAIKFADEQIGKILNQLELHPELYNNTVIVITSDHGFSLGEKKVWGKTKLWETHIRIPLIIADLRNVQMKTCNKAVGLLDLFPTFCDLAAVEYPTMPGGSNYFDGRSLLPLLNDPDTIWEHPVLTQILSSNLNCFPQNSVRTERWHLINYTSNNEDGIGTCDSSVAFQEAELYEIGINRNIDPEEWNNLAEETDYFPVKHYLQQFLPDSSLYGVQPFKVIVESQIPDCLQNENAIIVLESTLYSDKGELITLEDLNDYSFNWTNNLTNESFSGSQYFFDISSIDTEDFYSQDKIIFYIEVKNINTGKLAAFEVQYIDIYPPIVEPVATFNLNTDNLTVNVSDYILNGVYTSSYWDFGDGETSMEFIPSPHTYAETGEYVMTNFIQFANNCEVQYNKVIFVNESFEQQNNLLHFEIFPNPAYQQINIIFSTPLQNAVIKIGNITGQYCYNYTIENNNSNILTFDVTNFVKGIYFIEVLSDGEMEVKMFERM